MKVAEVLQPSVVNLISANEGESSILMWAGGDLSFFFLLPKNDVNHQILRGSKTNDAELSRGVRTQELGEERLSPPTTTTTLLLL